MKSTPRENQFSKGESLRADCDCVQKRMGSEHIVKIWLRNLRFY